LESGETFIMAWSLPHIVSVITPVNVWGAALAMSAPAKRKEATFIIGFVVLSVRTCIASEVFIAPWLPDPDQGEAKSNHTYTVGLRSGRCRICGTWKAHCRN
jgi:hypothetical protein